MESDVVLIFSCSCSTPPLVLSAREQVAVGAGDTDHFFSRYNYRSSTALDL